MAAVGPVPLALSQNQPPQEPAREIAQGPAEPPAKASAASMPTAAVWTSGGPLASFLTAIPIPTFPPREMMKPETDQLPELPRISDLIPAPAARGEEHREFLRAAVPEDRHVADAEDHVVVAVLRRSLDNINGFLVMVNQRNVVCGMPIVRSQIDTALCWFGRTLVQDSSNYVTHLAEGKRLSDYPDRGGRKLSDGYVHQELTRKHPWTSDLYKETSG